MGLYWRMPFFIVTILGLIIAGLIILATPMPGVGS